MYERQKLVPVRNMGFRDAGAIGALALAGVGLMRLNPLVLAGAYLVYKATRTAPREFIRNNVVPFLPAPGEIKKCVTIHEAPDTVFKNILALDLLEMLFPPLHESAARQGRQARVALGLPLSKEIPLLLKIKDSIEPRLAQLEISTLGDKVVGSCTVTLVDSKLGQGTSVEMVTHTRAGGIAARNMIKPFVTFSMDTYLFRLKQLCETGEIARSKGD